MLIILSLLRLRKNVLGLKSPADRSGLLETLNRAYKHNGLSLVHVPVYFGEEELGGLGAYGNWNVGNWCKSVQKRKHFIGL